MPPPSQAVVDAFKRFDTDMSGTITRDELAEAEGATWISPNWSSLFSDQGVAHLGKVIHMDHI